MSLLCVNRNVLFDVSLGDGNNLVFRSFVVLRRNIVDERNRKLSFIFFLFFGYKGIEMMIDFLKNVVLDI